MQKLTYSKKWPKFILAQKYLQMCSFIFEFDACDIYTYRFFFSGNGYFFAIAMFGKVVNFFFLVTKSPSIWKFSYWLRKNVPHTLLPSIVHPKSFQSTTYVTFWIKNVYNHCYWMSKENARNSDICYVPNVILSFIFQI